MLDLNDLRVFERVGSLGSFSAAARALSLPRSGVSRSVARLEAALGARLFHRTTREVELTAAGESLMARCAAALDELGAAIDHVGNLASEIRGGLRVSTGVGFGINVLTRQLPDFLLRHPKVDLSLDLSSRPADLISERVDVAIRLGPLPDSSMIAVRLGSMRRILCASPAYLERKGKPAAPGELARHDAIEMPGTDGRSRTWRFAKDGAEPAEVAIDPRVSVNEALSIHRLILNGAGLGIVSCYLCAPIPAEAINSGWARRALPPRRAPPRSANPRQPAESLRSRRSPALSPSACGSRDPRGCRRASRPACRARPSTARPRPCSTATPSPTRSSGSDTIPSMRRLLAPFLAFALLFQFSWAVAATYCGHEPSPTAAMHFGHHAHVHKSADGEKPPGGTLAQDDDCASCHAGHPAIVPLVASAVAAAQPSPANFTEPSISASAPPRTPDRPQWPRLA
ncbi:MAG: LysR substrate-binding domain-containing protein [Burkholderiaceae bacterium]